MVRIHLETDIAAPIERVFDLARDIDFHQRAMAHTDEQAIGGRTSGLIGPGETVTWQARHIGRTWSLTSKITAFEPPTRFVDEQTSGPFAWFRHETGRKCWFGSGRATPEDRAVGILVPRVLVGDDGCAAVSSR
jgi:ligand-binding SRPBCC domain-containing protein